MRYKVKGTIHRECLELGMQDEFEIIDTIDEDLRMLVAYFYEQHFNKPYNELSWYLEPGAKEFVKEVENKYWHNEIDSFALARDDKFIEFLSNNYECDFDENLLDEELDNYREEILDELRDLTLEELRDLPHWIDYEVYSTNYYRGDTIDIEEFIEDECLEEDE